MPASTCLTGEALAALTATREVAGAAGFRQEHLGVTLAGVDAGHDPSKVRAALADYLGALPRAAERGLGLVLEGGMGTGKTSALALIAEAAGRTFGLYDAASCSGLYPTYRPQVRYLLMPQLARFLMERVAGVEGQTRWRDEFDILKRAKFLLIDEFNAFYMDEYGTDKYLELMDERFSDRRVTCVALNGALADLRGHAIQARIIEKMKPKMILLRFPGASRRQWATLAELQGE